MGNGVEVMASANAAPGLADPLRSESETAGHRYRSGRAIFRSSLAAVTAAFVLFANDPAPLISAKWCELSLLFWPNADDQLRRSLLFYKAAYDRLEAEIRQARTAAALAAFRAEQQQVLGRIREEAQLLTGAVPAEIASILGSEFANSPVR
jgi:hypothetical protein